MRIQTALIMLLVLSTSLVACQAISAPQPTSTGEPSSQEADLAWNEDPSAIIVRHYSPYTTAGAAGAYDDRYYIPEVQIWGDGRIVWVTPAGQGRRVLEGQLTVGQMEALLRQIVDSGFFEWDDKYYTAGGHSLPPMHTEVNLIDRSKSISEHGGAPEAYHALEELLLTGAGAKGHDYVPKRGYLTVRSWPAEQVGSDWPAEMEWPEDAGITPADIGEGQYIEGEVLQYAWDAVNRALTGPAYVRHDEKTYVIMVQIPGLSYFEPPAPEDAVTH